MRRLFWVGVGAVGAVLAARRLEQVARRYTPAGVAEQVEEAGRRTEVAARGLVDRFKDARAQREQELVTTLLVTPEGGDPSAVFRRRRGDGDHLAWDDDAPGGEDAPDSRRSRRGSARPPGRVDDDEPLYDF